MKRTRRSTGGGRPGISVIMPVRPGFSPGKAIGALKRSVKPGETMELLLIEGEHPTRQRNVAAGVACAPALYFLDHDSEVAGETPRLLLKALRRADAAGGPNTGITGGGLLARAGELVLGSWLGSPFVRARYAPRGVQKAAGEKSLILCNLAVRKAVFERLRGFDPRLYPNEENEFLNRLGKSGGKALYVPLAQVKKPRWGSLAAFAGENIRYGRGRLEQIWVNPSGGDAVFLMILALAAAFPVVAWLWPCAWWLGGVYLAGVGVESVRLGVLGPKSVGNRLILAIFVSFLTVLRHLAYLGGMVLGAIWGWRKRGVGKIHFSFKLRVFMIRGGNITPISERQLQIGPVPAKVNTLC